MSVFAEQPKRANRPGSMLKAAAVLPQKGDQPDRFNRRPLGFVGDRDHPGRGDPLRPGGEQSQVLLLHPEIFLDLRIGVAADQDHGRPPLIFLRSRRKNEVELEGQTRLRMKYDSRPLDDLAHSGNPVHQPLCDKRVDFGRLRPAGDAAGDGEDRDRGQRLYGFARALGFHPRGAHPFFSGGFSLSLFLFFHTTTARPPGSGTWRK